MPGRYEVALRFYKERSGSATMDRDRLHRLARESSMTGRVSMANATMDTEAPLVEFSGEAQGSASSNHRLDRIHEAFTMARPTAVVVAISDWDVAPGLSAATPSVVLRRYRDKSTIVGGGIIFLGLAQFGALLGIVVGLVGWLLWEREVAVRTRRLSGEAAI